MPYEFLPDLATADIAFRAWGRTLEETFQAAADATLNVMVEDLESVEPRDERAIGLERESAEMLLFDFLQELIYYKDAEALLLRVPELEIRQPASRCVLRARARGERIDPARHRLRVDVKAVTLHEFRLEPVEGGWQAQVILDI